MVSKIGQERGERIVRARVLYKACPTSDTIRIIFAAGVFHVESSDSEFRPQVLSGHIPSGGPEVRWMASTIDNGTDFSQRINSQSPVQLRKIRLVNSRPSVRCLLNTESQPPLMPLTDNVFSVSRNP